MANQPARDEVELLRDALQQIQDGLFRYNMADYEACAKNAARRALDATRATLPTPVAKWQPIETAPKDQGILGGWYYNKEMWCWGRCEYDHGWYSISGGTPTHWMPLPAPPEAAATEGKK